MIPTTHSTYLQITKRDDAQHIVEGYASSEDIDQQPGKWQGQIYDGDVVEAQAISKALPAFMRWANLREMHGPNAIGTILSAEVVRGKVSLPDGSVITNPLKITAKIVDQNAWNKVVEGVYKGFSIQADVFKLRLAKWGGRLARIIQSLQLTEISLVDRPANPAAQIMLFKRQNMSEIISKAADAKAAIGLIQELRNACELSGDLTGAANYTNAIALLAQGMGAKVEIVAEADEEASPVEEESEEDDTPTNEEMQKTAQELDSEQEEEAPEESTEGKEEDGENKGVKKSAQATTPDHVKKLQNPAQPTIVETISKTEFTTLSQQVEKISKAFSGDIARIAKAYEELSDAVEALKDRPVLHELPISEIFSNGAALNQPIEIMKSLRNETDDPTLRELLGHKIAELEIKATPAQFVGYHR